MSEWSLTEEEEESSEEEESAIQGEVGSDGDTSGYSRFSDVDDED